MPNPGARFEWERRLLADQAIGGAQLAVLLTLATHYDRGTETVTAAQSTLAAEAGVGERTVRRALEWAEAAEYLHVVRRGRRVSDDVSFATTYELALPVPEPATVAGSDDGTTAAQPVTVAGSTPVQQSPPTDPNRPDATGQPATEDDPTGHTDQPTGHGGRLISSLSEVPSPPLSLPPTAAASDQEAAMRDYPIDSADARERDERGTPDASADRDRAIARNEVEFRHPELRPAEVDQVLDLLLHRAAKGYNGAYHRGLREQLVAEVKAERKRAGDGSAWYASLSADERSAWESRARQTLAAIDEVDPAPARLRAEVIRLGWRDRERVGAA